MVSAGGSGARSRTTFLAIAIGDGERGVAWNGGRGRESGPPAADRERQSSALSGLAGCAIRSSGPEARNGRTAMRRRRSYVVSLEEPVALLAETDRTVRRRDAGLHHVWRSRFARRYDRSLRRLRELQAQELRRPSHAIGRRRGGAAVGSEIGDLAVLSGEPAPGAA